MQYAFNILLLCSKLNISYTHINILVIKVSKSVINTNKIWMQNHMYTIKSCIHFKWSYTNKKPFLLHFVLNCWEQIKDKFDRLQGIHIQYLTKEEADLQNQIFTGKYLICISVPMVIYQSGVNEVYRYKYNNISLQNFWHMLKL